MKDYYKILGISRDASPEEIKKAYHRLAHQYHPDKAGGNEEKFKEINEAYQTLSNAEKRSQYDRFGQVFEGAGAPAGDWGFGFGDNIRWNTNFEDFGDLGDIFDTIFEQFGGRRRQTYTHGSDIETVIEITLKEAFNSAKKLIKLKTYVVCAGCNGLGYEKNKGLISCAMCQGRGEIKEQRQTFFGNFSRVKTCPHCRGRGEVPKSSCKDCGGKGRVVSPKEITVEIAAGVEDGQIIKIKGAGEAGEFGAGSGDLYVIIKVKTHHYFERRKNDLYMNKDISLTEALLGKKIPIEDISGEKFYVSLPVGFDLREKFKISGRGMPRFGASNIYSGRGDLYISLNLKLPKHLSEKAQKFLEELDKEIS